MKEKTRKSLAIWLLGMGIGIFILKNLINPGMLIEAFGGNIFEMSADMSSEMWAMKWSMMMNSISACIILIEGVFWFGGILILRKLLNVVTCKFFYRLIIGIILIPLVLSVVNILLFFTKTEIPLWFYVIFTFVKVVIVMSGAGVVRRNYILDSFLTSKLRLFQTGVLLLFSGFVFTAFWWYFKNVGIESRELSLMLSPIQYVNMVVYIAGCVCLFLGLKGIIQSDLLGENRKEDVFENVGGGWGGRPVIGAVGYCVFLLIFTIVASQTVVTY